MRRLLAKGILGSVGVGYLAVLYAMHPLVPVFFVFVLALSGAIVWAFVTLSEE